MLVITKYLAVNSQKGKIFWDKEVENNTGFVENLFYKLLVATESALKAV